MVTLAIYTLNFIHPGIFLKVPGPTPRDLRLTADEEAT